jgi:hypothetical protein
VVVGDIDAHHVQLVIAVEIAHSQFPRRALSRAEICRSAQLARTVTQHHEDAAANVGGHYVEFAVSIEIAHGYATERDGRRDGGGRYGSLKSAIALAEQYGDVLAKDQIGFAVPVEVADRDQVGGYAGDSCLERYAKTGTNNTTIRMSDLMAALLDVHSNSIRRLSIRCQHQVRLARASQA